MLCTMTNRKYTTFQQQPFYLVMLLIRNWNILITSCNRFKIVVFVTYTNTGESKVQWNTLPLDIVFNFWRCLWASKVWQYVHTSLSHSVLSYLFWFSLTFCFIVVKFRFCICVHSKRHYFQSASRLFLLSWMDVI